MINCASGVTISRVKMQRRRLGSQPSLTVADEKAASFRAGILSAGLSKSAFFLRAANLTLGSSDQAARSASAVSITQRRSLVDWALKNGLAPIATLAAANEYAAAVLANAAHYDGWLRVHFS